MVRKKNDNISWELTQAHTPTAEEVNATETTEEVTPTEVTTEEAETSTTPTTEEETATDTTEATEEATEEDAYTPLMNHVMQRNARAQQLAEKAALEEEQAREFERAFHESGIAGREKMLDMLKDREPQRDVDQEKRLRTLSKVQAWGDMLNALTAGIVANTGKYGKGYVPYIPKNSALGSIDKLNKMQDEYRKRKLEWDNNMLNFELGNEQAKMEAAKALATNAANKAAATRKAAAEAEDDAVSSYEDMVKFIMREQGLDRRHAQDIIARYQTTAMRNASDANKAKAGKDEGLAIRLLDHFEPWTAKDKTKLNEFGEEVAGGKSTYKEDYLERKNLAPNRPSVIVAMDFMDAGYSEYQVINNTDVSDAIKKIVALLDSGVSPDSALETVKEDYAAKGKNVKFPSRIM